MDFWREGMKIYRKKVEDEKETDRAAIQPDKAV